MKNSCVVAFGPGLRTAVNYYSDTRVVMCDVLEAGCASASYSAGGPRNMRLKARIVDNRLLGSYTHSTFVSYTENIAESE